MCLPSFRARRIEWVGLRPFPGYGARHGQPADKYFKNSFSLVKSAFPTSVHMSIWYDIMSVLHALFKSFSSAARAAGRHRGAGVRVSLADLVTALTATKARAAGFSGSARRLGSTIAAALPSRTCLAGRLGCCGCCCWGSVLLVASSPLLRKATFDPSFSSTTSHSFPTAAVRCFWSSSSSTLSSARFCAQAAARKSRQQQKKI